MEEPLDTGADMGNSVPRTTLPAHGTTRYIRTHLAVDDGVLRWEVPRTLLGMIPVGSRLIEVPLDEVDELVLRRVVAHPFRRAIGAALVVLPWLLLPWWLSVPLVILGLWTIVITFGPQVELRTKAGVVHRSPVCLSHSLDAELYMALVEDMIKPVAG